MRRAAILLLVALAAAPEGTRAATHGARTTVRRHAPAAPAAPSARSTRARRSAPSLAEAKAALVALTRDRVRRRYRHHWERAIANLVRAARGRDAAPALLEAARARYALYRWSADEADRDAALRLAARATRAGSRDAHAFAAAIRREAGDDRPVHRTASRAHPPAPAAPTAPPRRATARAAAPPAPAPAEDEEAAPEPALEAAVAEMSDAPAAPRLALGASAADGPARVSAVRSWSGDEYTRVAIYLSHWVGWQKLELPQDGALPRRLALDLRPAQLDGKAVARAIDGAQVDRVRVAQNDPGTVRVVLDLPGDEAVHAFGLDDPPRLVVDVGTRRAAREVAAASAPAAAPTPERSSPAQAPATEPSGAGAEATPAAAEGGSADDGEEATPEPVHRIVVDAGHGGYDPGAIGPDRIREKTVTLAIARRLARRLRAAGFQVVLTRKDDRFVPLEERTAIANAAHGDLFVSVHANANPRRARTGVETYFLNVADDRYAARLAARENGLDPGEEGGAEVQRILTDVEAKTSTALSRRLARDVQRELCAAVRDRYGAVHDLGVKSALFYVLLGARMPAVLVETAFISNRAEERRLASPRYQEDVAGAIARAVAGFARRAERVASARVVP